MPKISILVKCRHCNCSIDIDECETHLQASHPEILQAIDMEFRIKERVAMSIDNHGFITPPGVYLDEAA